MHFKSLTTALEWIKAPYILGGDWIPRPSVPNAETLTTSPSRQGTIIFLVRLYIHNLIMALGTYINGLFTRNNIFCRATQNSVLRHKMKPLYLCCMYSTNFVFRVNRPSTIRITLFWTPMNEYLRINPF
jgi:hypothetical protein